MTETELKRRLSADVDDIEAPSDLLDRARLGGARRLRRRRFTTIAAGSLAVLAIAGATVAVPALRDRADQPPAATTTPWVDPIKTAPDDEFAFLMKGATRGDLAGDQSYLDEVRTTWQEKQRREARRPADPIAGNWWAEVRGEPRIYWAGTTAAGRVAIVLQHFRIPNPDPNTKYAYTGVHTAIAFVTENADGKPQAGTVEFQHTENQNPMIVVTKGTTNVVVAVDMGRRVSWGVTPEAAKPLHFENGVAVAAIPPSVPVDRVVAWPLPGR